MTLSDHTVKVDLSLSAWRTHQLRDLKVDQLESRGSEAVGAECKNFPRAERVRPRVIGLLKKVSNVFVVILATVFGGNLEAALGQNPARENFRELVVADAPPIAERGRESRIIDFDFRREVRLEESLKDFSEICSRQS
jgi:hypothetical protein